MNPNDLPWMREYLARQMRQAQPGAPTQPWRPGPIDRCRRACAAAIRRIAAALLALADHVSVGTDADVRTRPALGGPRP